MISPLRRETLCAASRLRSDRPAQLWPTWSITRIYVTDISRWREVGEVHAQAFGKIRPVTSMVEVTALIAPGLLVEIEADAYVGSAVADRNSGAGPKDPSPAGG